MNDRDFLYRQLIRLGDMIGDGLHHDPSGKWITKEYKQILKILGIMPKRKNNSKVINDLMAKRIKEVACQKCQGCLKQSRSGSNRAICVDCGAKFQLLKSR